MRLSPQGSHSLMAARDETLSRYGSFNEFEKTYSVMNLVRYTENRERCFFGNAPTLSEINKAYGSHSAQQWLVYFLGNFSEYAGARRKLSVMQISELSELIASEYYYLKVTELMLFFRGLKAGEYSTFYGSVDPLVIMDALHEFERLRNDAIARHESEMLNARLAEQKRDAVTYDEYTHTEIYKRVREKMKKRGLELSKEPY